MNMIRRVMAVARALAALALIMMLLVGVPVLLIELIGNPVPQNIDWNSPLSDRALLGLVACLAWVFWVQMTVCIVVETIAEARLAAGRSADWMSRVPGTLGGQQALARLLVQTVVTVGLTSAVAASSLPTWTTTAAPAMTERAPAQPVVTTQTSAVSSAPAQSGAGLSTTTVEVVRGDSLWSIAEERLGNGERWKEIASLNQGRLMPDGNRFLNASAILPGWQLVIPRVSTNASTTVTVRRGDTLWGLSEARYGDGKDWPRVFAANRDTLTDPGLLIPGERLLLPGSTPPTPNPVTPPEPTHIPPPASPPPHHLPQPSPPQPSSQPEDQQTPSPSGSPSAPPPDSTSSDSSAPSQVDAHHGEADGTRSNTLALALAGSGGVLAAGLLAGLSARRRSQFRVRRSGRTVASTPTELRHTEQTVRTSGSTAGEAAQFLDVALRDLVLRTRRSGGQLPEVRAARLSDESLELVVPDGTHSPPLPWMATPMGNRWSLSRDHGMDPGDAIAPYPTLVSMGSDEDGGTWLIDVESAGIVRIAGDVVPAADLLRFMAAELALNPWAATVDATVSGVAAELVGLNPSRLSASDTADLSALTRAARRSREAGEAVGLSVLGGRSEGTAADGWMPAVALALTRGEDLVGVDELGSELAMRRPGRSSVAAVLAGGLEQVPLGVTLQIIGRTLVTPWADLTANHLTADEAKTLADLFGRAEVEQDEPMPLALRADGGESDSDAAGALRSDLVEPRDQAGDSSSLLPLPDSQYVFETATTQEDLAALAPRISAEARSDVVGRDPMLDADLADWFESDSPRPKIRVLGPVEARVAGPRPPDVERRTAYYAELIAYLASRPEGATPAQMADAFLIQNNTLHSRIGALRKWLGTDPETDEWYLPESALSAAGKARGVPVYQLSRVLSDADLFKRLRTRGQALGPEGVADLVSALKLVRGRPFDQLRSGGYGWLSDVPLDHYLTAGIVDVAHVVATHGLSEGDLELATWAAEIAIAAAPSEDKPRLDLTRAHVAAGATNASDELRRSILDRSDDDAAPPEPSPRTSEIISRLRE